MRGSVCLRWARQVPILIGAISTYIFCIVSMAIKDESEFIFSSLKKNKKKRRNERETRDCSSSSHCLLF